MLRCPKAMFEITGAFLISRFGSVKLHGPSQDLVLIKPKGLCLSSNHQFLQAQPSSLFLDVSALAWQGKEALPHYACMKERRILRFPAGICWKALQM